MSGATSWQMPSFDDLLPNAGAAPDAAAPPVDPAAGWQMPSFDDLMPKQSLPAALGNTAMSGLIGSAGLAVAAPSRIRQAADKRDANTMLRAVEILASDESAAYRALTQMQRGVLTAYRRATPERQAEMQAEWQGALTQGTPAMVERGDAISQYGRDKFPVDPAQKGDLTNAVGMIASLPLALGAGAAGAMVGGPAGGFAGMTSVIYAQAYESTYQEAIEKGATPEKAAEVASKNAGAQSLLNFVPLARVIGRIPAGFRDEFIKTVAKYGQSSLEFGTANALGRFIKNFIYQKEVDPNQSLTEGVWDDTKAGLLVGPFVLGSAAAGSGAGRVVRNQLGQAASPEVRHSLNQIERLADEAQPTIAPEAAPVDGLPPWLQPREVTAGGEPSTPAQGTIPLQFDPNIPTMRITPEPEAPDGPLPAWQVENAAAIRDLLAKAPAIGEQIKALHGEGKTASEIAAELGGGWSTNDIRAARDALGLVPHGPAVGLLGKIPESGTPPDGVPEGPMQETLPAEMGRPAEDVAPAPDAPDFPVAGGKFTTAKGSSYVVHEDGTTTRDKAYRPEHGEKEQGPQPRSERTFYVSAEDALKLAEFQAQGSKKEIVIDRGHAAVRYVDGPSAGKIERRTVVPFETAPRPGLTPVELWKDGRVVHFGNEITAYEARPAAMPPPMADLRRPAKPPSLFDFLISKGGIKPDGDLLALGLNTVHHQRAGRLLNKNGMTVDRAREVAAHYLRTGRDDGGRYGERTEGDVADFYNALAEEHAGRPVYPPEYASEANEWAQGRAADRERIRGEELAVEARAAAEESGVRLTPDEEMHAARLMVEGARPEEAVYEAVRASDVERTQAYNEARGMLSAREKGQADQRAVGAPSPEAGRARQELAVVMQRLMRQAGLPSSVGLKLVDRLVDAEGNAADASYARSLVTFALDTPAREAPVKLFHEVTHALMDPQLGVLTQTQRNALLRAADRWLAQGENREGLADLRYTPEQMREEAVARVAEEVVTKARREAPITTRAVEAMTRAVEAIGSGLRGQGFWSADGVFRAVMQGRVKGEGKGGADGSPQYARRPLPESLDPQLPAAGGSKENLEKRNVGILSAEVTAHAARFTSPEGREYGALLDAQRQAWSRVDWLRASVELDKANLRDPSLTDRGAERKYGTLQRNQAKLENAEASAAALGVDPDAPFPGDARMDVPFGEFPGDREYAHESYAPEGFPFPDLSVPEDKRHQYHDPRHRVRQGDTPADESPLYARRPPKPPPSGPDLFGGERREPEQRAAVPTYRNDPRQEAMPGMEPSAVQAQAARDQTGRGGLEPRVPQARPDEGLFARPQAETPSLIVPRPLKSRFIGNISEFVDMIDKVPNTGRPHVDSRAFTLERGKDGFEYLSIVEAGRNQVVHAGTTNKRSSIQIDTTQLDLAPDGSLIVHHNHPRQSSLSMPDYAMSAIQALGPVVAHAGEDMHIGRPGPRLMEAIEKKRRDRWGDLPSTAEYAAADAALAGPYKRAIAVAKNVVQGLINDRLISHHDANRALGDMVNRLLHQGGWVDYTTTYSVPSALDTAWRIIQRDSQKDASLAGDRRARSIRLDEGLASLSGPMGRDAGSRPVQDPPSGSGSDPRGTGPAGRQDRLLEGEGQFGAKAPEEGTLLSRRAARQPNLGLSRPAWEIEDPSMVDSFVRTMQDNKIDLKKVQQRITDLYGPIPESRDAYEMETNYHGRVSARVKALHEKRVEPILQKIAKNREGVTVDDVDRYLLARHAPERNAKMKEINPDRVDNEALSGMSDADAAAAMDAFERAGKLNRLESIAKDVDKLTADTRKVIKAEGLETADTIKAWEDAYQFYAPLQRDIEGNGAPKGSGFNVRGPESKRSMGSTLEVKNILANIVAQAETAAIRAEKNKVTTALADLAKQYPADGFWKVDEVPTTRQINKNTGLVETIPDPLYQLADNVVMYKEGGKHHFIVFDERNKRAVEVARAMKNMDAGQISLFTKIIALPARFMASLLTRWNPEFWVTNFIRDVGGAQFNWFGTGLKEGRRDVISNVPKAMRGLRDLYRGDGNSEWARYAKEMDAAGGTTGHMDMYETSDKRMDNLRAEVAKMEQGAGDPRRIARTVLQAVDDYNSIVENSVRLAAFQAARKQGLTQQRAASIAKNITVNFNRKGNASAGINAWFMFFNASVQGAATILKAAAKSPKARAVLGGMAVTGFLLDMVNREVMGDDYEAIPDFEKSHNAIFAKSDGTYVKVPYPLGLNAVFNVGRLTSEAISGKSHKKPIEYGVSMAAAMLDAFNPLGSVGSAAQLVAPSVFRPVAQLWDNVSFTGAPVYKSGDRGPRGDAPEPAHRRHFQNTPELWKAMSRGINALTGGDYAEKGAVDVSPDALRHIFTSMTGGMGRAADRTLDYFTSDEPSASRMPFVGRVVGKVDDRMKERAYMGEARRINTAINEVDFLLKSGRPDAADDIIKKLGKGNLDEGFRILGSYRAAKKELDTLRRREAPVRMTEPDDETNEIGRIMRDMRRQSMDRALREGRP